MPFRRIINQIQQRFQELPTRAEKLRFMYEVQERLRIYHNNQGQRFQNAQMTQEEWDTFKTEWKEISQAVAKRIANLRDIVFKEDFALVEPKDPKDTATVSAWSGMKETLKTGGVYTSEIDTIWQ